MKKFPFHEWSDFLIPTRNFFFSTLIVILLSFTCSNTYAESLLVVSNKPASSGASTKVSPQSPLFGIQKQTVKVVAFGDSNTWGGKWFPALQRTYSSRLQLINQGVSGEGTLEAKHRFPLAVLKQKPDVVLMMYGTNDAVVKSNGQASVSKQTFEKNLRYMVEEAQKNGIQVILMTTIPIIDQYFYKDHNRKLYVSYGGARKWLNSYNDITRRLATEYKVPLVDNFKNFITKAGKDTDTSLIKSGLINESGIHMTQLGAEVVFRGLRDVNNSKAH